MHLNYDNKKTEEEIRALIDKTKLTHVDGNINSRCKLIKGENLQVMKCLVDEAKLKGSVDLVYIDPPFATSNVFTLSDDKANSISRSYRDTIAYNDTLTGAEYLEFIRERLILIRDLMSENGSIYFHIDYKIGHYIKIIMDEVFGKKNYLSTISRIKCNPKNFKRKSYGNIKDMILFYSKTGKHIWNNVKVPLTDKEKALLFPKIDKDDRYYTTIPLHAPGETKNGDTGKPWRGVMPPKGRHWRSSPSVLEELDRKGLVEWSKNLVPRKKIFADESEGKLVQDVMEFKDAQKPSYPTEKNLNLLKLLISSSTNEDSIVFDCFCGSGTALQAARELGRSWIGIDQSVEAINKSLKRLNKDQPNILDIDEGFAYYEQHKPENIQIANKI